jgi:molybdenum cofactor biosynthesis enzyme
MEESKSGVNTISHDRPHSVHSASPTDQRRRKEEVKNKRKTISNEEKLDIINQLKKDVQIIDMCHNIRLTCCYVQFVIMPVELKTVLSVSMTLCEQSKAQSV